MLASDSEREAVVKQLRASHLQGVLGADTYERRVEATLRATRRGELRALVADLPRARETLRDAFTSLVHGRAHPGALQVVLPGWTDPPFLIGRSRTCDLVLDDDTVSARHAEIRPLVERDAWLLVDLGSLNGTWFLNRRIGRTVVRTGDETLVGQTALVLVTA